MYTNVRVEYLDSEIPPIELVPIVSEILEVFLYYLPGISREWKIDFVIDLLTIQIPFKFLLMALTDLKELKSQLKVLLYKGFI